MKLFFGEVFPEVLINEEEQQHILKVLRMRDGDTLYITDGKGNLAKGTLTIEGKKAKVDNVEIQEKTKEYSPSLHIAIAPTKNIDRIEFFLEKAVEMGIAEITFLQTDNTERKNINIEKLRKQAVGASKQSLRRYFPIINDSIKLTDFISKQNPNTTFVAHCDEKFDRLSLDSLPKIEQYTFLIGPEGDFSEKEINYLTHNKIKAVTLGPQRLRTETAGVFISAFIYSNY